MSLDTIIGRCRRPPAVEDGDDNPNKNFLIPTQVSSIMITDLIYSPNSALHVIHHLLTTIQQMVMMEVSISIDGTMIMFKCHVHQCIWLLVRIIVSISRIIICSSREIENQCGQPFARH